VRHPARWAAAAVALVVVVLGVVLAVNVGSGDSSTTPTASPFLGKQVPSFDLPQLSGDRVSSDSTAGKVVIINFWNTWCIPCQQELPALQGFWARHGSEPDVQLVGILRDPQESLATVRDYVSSHHMAWTIAQDPGDKAALDFGTRGQPETIAVSPSGIVVASKYGPTTENDLEQFLAVARRAG
jgi:peroxiredoxin